MLRVKVTACLLLVLITAACALSSSPTETYCTENAKNKPMIQTATWAEFDAVLKEVDTHENCSTEGFNYVLATEKGHSLVVFLGGVGPESVTTSTELMLSTLSPVALVFSGTAGGLNSNATIGETFIVATWYDSITGKSVMVSEQLRSLATAENIAVTYVEYGVTSPTFISDPTEATQLSNAYHADIVNMEDYYVAEIAGLHNVPFISVRSVSDMANGSVEVSNRNLAAANSAYIAIQIVDALYK